MASVLLILVPSAWEVGFLDWRAPALGLVRVLRTVMTNEDSKLRSLKSPGWAGVFGLPAT